MADYDDRRRDDRYRYQDTGRRQRDEAYSGDDRYGGGGSGREGSYGSREGAWDRSAGRDFGFVPHETQRGDYGRGGFVGGAFGGPDDDRRRSGYDSGDRMRGGYGQTDYSRGDTGRNEYQGGSGYRTSDYGSTGGASTYNYGQQRGNQGREMRDSDRGFFERAGDEIASWFGSDEAERRRNQDAYRGDEGAQHHRGRGPRNYTRSDDRIRDDVNDRLTDDPYVDASDIDVTVSNCEVTLSGQVDSRQDKRRAEDLAEHVSGVRHVQNNLRVRERTGSSYGAGRTQTIATMDDGRVMGSGTSGSGSTTVGTTSSGSTTGTSSLPGSTGRDRA